MAKNESTSNNQNSEIDPRPVDRHFSPVRFSRKEADSALLPGFAVLHYADVVQDVASGASSILRLVEWDETMSELESDTNRPPLLNASHKSAMLRLVAASMDLLVEQSEHLTTWAYEYHTEQGRAERVETAEWIVAQHNKNARVGGIA
jgi:hypothetical protein